ncbi:hypothetical protein QTO34_012633 [Cnephaeus nilssonii]|uniref:Uncharacterized protein n=1 Tax=Cnephaeus nilssonii TaxID=3371016 RepID=A0AA40HAZ4_CNENI|nr:hypothetical protein QTO34_012633 [Eptesicus nilssonii]
MAPNHLCLGPCRCGFILKIIQKDARKIRLWEELLGGGLCHMLAPRPLAALLGGLRPGRPDPQGGLCAREQLRTAGREALPAEPEAGVLAALRWALLRPCSPLPGIRTGPANPVKPDPPGADHVRVMAEGSAGRDVGSADIRR